MDPIFSPVMMSGGLGAMTAPAAGSFSGAPQATGAPMNILPQPAAMAPQRPTINSWLQNNPALVWSLAAGLMGGRNAIPQAFANMPQAMQADQQFKQREEQRQAVAKWLKSQGAMGPDTQALIQAADPGDVTSAVLKNTLGSGAGTYGREPIWFQDENNNWVVGQMGSKGDVVRSALPDNLRPVPPGDIAASKSAGTAEGKSQGEATALYKSMMSKMPSLQSTVEQLEVLADQATYTQVGQWRDKFIRETGQEPTPEAIAREKYIATIDNVILPLLRDTFGAQFTENEGKALRATLGNPNLSPPEKKAVLNAFIEQKKLVIESLARQTGQPLPNWDQTGTGAPPTGQFDGGGDVDALIQKYAP